MSDIPIYTVYGKTPIRKGKTYSDKDCFMVKLTDYEKLQSQLDEANKRIDALEAESVKFVYNSVRKDNEIQAEGIIEARDAWSCNTTGTPTFMFFTLYANKLRKKSDEML